LEKEVVSAKKELEKKLGLPFPILHIPVVNIIKTLYAYLESKIPVGLTMDDGIIKSNSDALVLPRIGVDRTHSFSEFTNAFSPSVVRLRRVIKKVRQVNIYEKSFKKQEI